MHGCPWRPTSIRTSQTPQRPIVAAHHLDTSASATKIQRSIWVGVNTQSLQLRSLTSISFLRCVGNCPDSHSMPEPLGSQSSQLAQDGTFWTRNHSTKWPWVKIPYSHNGFDNHSQIGKESHPVPPSCSSSTARRRLRVDWRRKRAPWLDGHFLLEPSFTLIRAGQFAQIHLENEDGTKNLIDQSVQRPLGKSAILGCRLNTSDLLIAIVRGIKIGANECHWHSRSTYS